MIFQDDEDHNVMPEGGFITPFISKIYSEFNPSIKSDINLVNINHDLNGGIDNISLKNNQLNKSNIVKSKSVDSLSKKHKNKKKSHLKKKKKLNKKMRKNFMKTKMSKKTSHPTKITRIMKSYLKNQLIRQDMIRNLNIGDVSLSIYSTQGMK